MLEDRLSSDRSHQRATRSGRGYTSAKLISQGKQQFKYGRIDIRANLPYGQGLWPALLDVGCQLILK